MIKVGIIGGAGYTAVKEQCSLWMSLRMAV